MQMLGRFFLCFVTALKCQYSSAHEKREFNPIPMASAMVMTNNQMLEFNTAGFGKTNHHVVPLEIITNTSTHIKVGDYNFDGALDFCISYVDEGKRTYTINRIFIFSKSTMTFEEIFPNCGDEFINLKVDVARRRLISTYSLGNVAMRCSTKPRVKS